MNTIEMLLQPENTPELLLMCVCLAIAAVAIVAIVMDVIRCRRQQDHITKVDRRCERTGSQDEFTRRLRARG